MRFIPILFTGLLWTGCASSPNKAKEIETELDLKSQGPQGAIGLNREGEVIIQREDSADGELRAQVWANNKIESELAHEHRELRQCRIDIADPRLGGDGAVKELPEVDSMKALSETKEEFGIAEDGELKFVKREFYLQRLNAERKYQTALDKMLILVKKHRDDCEQQMMIARRKVGLPGKRYEADGYFMPDGTWVEIRGAERNIDDAFEMRARAKNQREAELPESERLQPEPSDI